MSESLEEARHQLQQALSQPGHSPLEDALLDAVAALLDTLAAIEKRLDNERIP